MSKRDTVTLYEYLKIIADYALSSTRIATG